MINELKIKNFQSHKNTVLEFDKGVNIIVGTSDSGKSAILRSLRWIIDNRPSGDEFRSSWGGDTEATVLLDCGNEVSRVKNKKMNGYLINGETRKATNRKVPEDIQEALNIGESNVQRQSDSPFLISNTPGEVAQHFNKVANLEQIDVAQGNIKSWVRKLNTDLTYKKDEIKEQIKKLKEFDYLIDFESEVKKLEALETSCTDFTQKIKGITGVIADCEGIDEKAEKLNTLLLSEGKVEEALRLCKYKKHLHNQNTRVSELLKSVTRTREKIREQETLITLEKNVQGILRLYEGKQKKSKELKRLSNLTKLYEVVNEDLEEVCATVEMEDSVDSILVLWKEKTKVKDKNCRIFNLLDSVDKVNAKIKRNAGNVKELETEFKNEMPEACPLCSDLIKK